MASMRWAVATTSRFRGLSVPVVFAVAMAVAGGLAAPAAAHAPTKDCPQGECYGLSGPGRIVVVGDLHGDLSRSLETLRAAAVVDATGRWVGGDTTLVQTGDILDRGPDVRALLDLFMRLEGEAADSGGRVLVLNGNHEVSNLQDAWVGMVHPEEWGDFGGRAARAAALAETGTYGAWMRQLPAVAVVGDTVFAHAGLTPYAARVLGVNGTNSALRRILLPDTHGLPPWAADPAVPRCRFGAEEAPCIDEASALRLVTASEGPLWTRSFARWDEEMACTAAAESLHALSRQRSDARLPPVTRMVVGHTPQQAGAPTVRCNGALVLNDVGISRWVSEDGAVGAVEIVDGVLHTIDGTATR